MVNKRIGLNVSIGLACGLLAGLSETAAWAHGSFHAQIEVLNQQIRESGATAELYLRRAELHRLHQDWDAAFADVERAAALDPKDDRLLYSRGLLLSEAGWPQSARLLLDRFLLVHTNHAQALVARAHVLLKLGEPLRAAEDFTRAIRAASAPGPELYIERSQALLAAGEPHQEAALLGLDEGIKKLGPLVTLQLLAIDVETKRTNYAGALKRLDSLSAQSPRKETWLARRGEILQQAGRLEESRAAFRAALEATEKLPPARRNVPAMLELQKRLRQQLEAAPAAESKR